MNINLDKYRYIKRGRGSKSSPLQLLTSSDDNKQQEEGDTTMSESEISQNNNNHNNKNDVDYDKEFAADCQLANSLDMNVYFSDNKENPTERTKRKSRQIRAKVKKLRGIHEVIKKKQKKGSNSCKMTINTNRKLKIALTGIKNTTTKEIKSQRKLWNKHKHKLTLNSLSIRLADIAFKPKMLSFTTIPAWTPKTTYEDYQDAIEDLDAPPFVKIAAWMKKMADDMEIDFEKNGEFKCKEHYLQKYHKMIKNEGFYEKNSLGHLSPIPLALDYSVDVFSERDSYGGIDVLFLQNRLPQILAEGGNFAGAPGTPECWTVSGLINHLRYYWN